jgi:cell division protein FtsL
MRSQWMPIWVVPILIVFAIGTVWLRLSIVRTTYAINQAERDERSLRQEREDMELKVTALRSPRRLEGIAKTKFGLGTPRSDQVIHLGSRNGP